MTQMHSDDEIVRLAALMMKVDQGGEYNDEVGPTKLGQDNFMMVRFASKIMQGRPYTLTSDNAKHIELHRALARRLGATEETAPPMAPGMPPQIMFRPAARQ
jgi:hypothetical protein